jgi:hypothetical protein
LEPISGGESNNIQANVQQDTTKCYPYNDICSKEVLFHFAIPIVQDAVSKDDNEHLQHQTVDDAQDDTVAYGLVEEGVDDQDNNRR